MKKNLKRLFLLTLILLLALAGGALAQAPASDAEEVVLVADLAAFRETGELFEGVKPGMSLEEVLAAGIPIITDTWGVPMMSEEGQTFMIKQNYVVMLEGIRLPGIEGLGAFTCHFYKGALKGIANMHPGEEYRLEEILPVITAVLGEPAEQNTTENTHMGWDLSRYTTKETYIDWNFDLDGEKVTFSISASDHGEGAMVGNISVNYLNYIQSTDEAE